MSSDGVELRGAKELAAFLRLASGEVATKAGKGGVSKAASRLRTYLRRAAPRKTGKLRNAIRTKLGKGAIAWVKLTIGYYYTLEFGRGAHTRLGRPRAGSPQMARFAFFMKTWQSKENEIAQYTVDATRASLFKETARAISRTAAPVRWRGSR